MNSEPSPWLDRTKLVPVSFQSSKLLFSLAFTAGTQEAQVADVSRGEAPLCSLSQQPARGVYSTTSPHCSHYVTQTDAKSSPLGCACVPVCVCARERFLHLVVKWQIGTFSCLA